MNDLLQEYVWCSAATPSGDWPETKKHLGRLSTALKLALSAEDENTVMDTCRQILSWGGDRNPKVGASPFLESLHKDKALTAYLVKAKRAFRLDEANTNAAHVPATRMNSMLTKVHALASDDGLPIYDSRVAAAIAALVELWRRKNGCQAVALPDELVFPATMSSRTVQHLFGDAIAPGVMSYAPTKTAQTVREWSGAKIRLAWIMAKVLREAGTLFASEGKTEASERMHAFEATLFLIGYDVQCLTRNSAIAGVAPRQLRELRAAARKTLQEDRGESELTSISTLTGTEKKLRYAGDIETGISGIWGDLRFAFERDFLQELLGNFQSLSGVELGASRTGEVGERTLGRWIDDNHPSVPRMYASALAAILVNEKLAERVPGTRPIQLRFL